MTTNNATKAKTVLLKPIRPSAAIAQQYESALQKQVEAMHKSVIYWIKAQYRANSPEFASDASIQDMSPTNALNLQIARLRIRWEKAFKTGAKELASWFSQKAMDRSQEQLKRTLKDAGFSVQFKLTANARNAFNAVVADNVGLIKSIPEQYLNNVQGAVMRSVSTGRDLKSLASEVEKQYGLTKRRAAFIAIDQNNKATAVINKVRQQELGITKAVWKHSHAGKHPRVSHLAYDGKEYDIEKGAYIDGKYIWPGTEPRCRCTSQSVIKGFIL